MLKRSALPIVLSFSISLTPLLMPIMTYADPVDARTIQGGAYYNTAGNQATFIPANGSSSTNTPPAAGNVNSVSNGALVQGGTYFNTPGGKTTFINSAGEGLWLQSGAIVRGLEASTNKNPIGNGGTLHVYAPDRVIKLDGSINVSPIRSGQGTFLGNGGKIMVDAASQFQNGTISANGPQPLSIA